MASQIVNHTGLARIYVEELMDPDVWMDTVCLFAYLCDVAVKCRRKVAVVPPEYTSALNQPYLCASEQLRHVYTSTNGLADVYVIPVHTGAHFSIAIYESNSSVINYYDPLPGRTLSLGMELHIIDAVSRLTNNNDGLRINQVSLLNKSSFLNLYVFRFPPIS